MIHRVSHFLTNFCRKLLENCLCHSLSLSDPDRSLVLSHFLTNFLQNLASCHTALRLYEGILLIS
jgi:hypothetical protein